MLASWVIEQEQQEGGKAGRREARASGSRATRHDPRTREERFRPPSLLLSQGKYFWFWSSKKPKCALAFPADLPAFPSSCSLEQGLGTSRQPGACRSMRPRDAREASAIDLRLGSQRDAPTLAGAGMRIALAVICTGKPGDLGWDYSGFLAVFMRRSCHRRHRHRPLPMRRRRSRQTVLRRHHSR